MPEAPNQSAKLVLLDEEHTGRDEMNLAGNPFALLQAAAKSGQTYLRREWPRQLPNGKIVTASWKVDGDSELGMPGPNEELLYLVLLQISREQKDQSGEWPRTVHFSRHDVLKRLKWQDGPREYKTLRDGFYRLQSVSIQSEYSFHDPRTGAPLPAIAFNLIDSFAFVDEKKNRRAVDLPFSWFKWSEVILDSLKSGNVRSLALDFTLSLDSPISRRLFRLLELMRHSRKPPLQEVRLEVFAIRDRLGMADYKFPSKVKEKLAPAIEELISRGYLASVEYEKDKRVENAIFSFENVSINSVSISEREAQEKALKRSECGSVSETEVSQTDVRAYAVKCHAIFQSLTAEEQVELMALAKTEVSPIWHDRVGQVDSPMSLGLWQLVEQRHFKELK